MASQYVTNNIEHTTVTKSTYSYSRSRWDLEVTADDGYVFSDAPTVTYVDTNGKQRTFTFELSADKKTASIQVDTYITSVTPMTLDGTTTPEKVEPTITNNVSNTTVSYTGTNPFSLTLTADDGYKFDTSPTATYKNTDGTTQTDTFLLSGDSKTATLTTSTLYSTDLAIKVDGTTTPEKVEPTITNNIANSTYSYSGSDHQYIITVESKTGYLFSGVVVASYTGYSSDEPVSSTFVVSDDKKTAKGVCPDVDENTPIVLTGTTVKDAKTTIKTSLSNCSVVGTLPESIVSGETLNVTLQANDNTHFESTPKFTWYDSSGYLKSSSFTLSSDNLSAIGVFTNPDYVPTYVTIGGSAVPDTIIGANYGTINVYKVTLDNLKAFSAKRFFKESVNSDGTEFTLINLGGYVNRLKRLFFPVPVASTDVIKCGNYNTGVECEAPDTDTVTLNFGSITVPTPNGDITDYQSELQLFVPFKGFVTLPVDYVGKTITLTYTINVITGGGVAKVLCGDDVVLLLDVEPNEDILYQTNLDNLATVGGDVWNEEYLYGIEPFLYMKYYNSLNKTARNNDYENTKLGDLIGFCVVDGVTLSTTAKMTVEEQETIISLLSNGVYIEH